MRRLLLVLPLLSLALPASRAHAEETRMSRTDGAKLLSVCTAGAANLVQGCEAYIDGVADTIGVYQHRAENPDGATKLAERTCVPGGETGVRLREKVVAFLKSHPDDRGRFAALIVSRALHEAYPCH